MSSTSIPFSSSSITSTTSDLASPSFKSLSSSSSSSTNTSVLKYNDLLKQLYNISLYSPNKKGLTNMERLLEHLNNPHKDLKFIHVTGTNGKGSVVIKLSQILMQVGKNIQQQQEGTEGEKKKEFKVGIFTSPHLSSFRERIVINNEMISEEDIEKFLPQIFQICQRESIPATFFEITTALAFLKYKQEAVDYVVLEVGLGGRLDATNIINSPLASVITSVQLDHVSILGDTIEKIAREKGGIIKKNRPVIVGPGCPHQILKEMAMAIESPYYHIDRTGLSGNLSEEEKQEEDLKTLRELDTDEINTEIVKKVIKVLQDEDKSSNNIFNLIDFQDEYFLRCLQSRPPCRFQELIVYKPEETNISTTSSSENSQKKIRLTPNYSDSRVRIILDIAHNFDSIQALSTRLSKKYKNQKIKVILGMSSDKDINSCLPLLLRVIQNNQEDIYCTSADTPRAIKKEVLREKITTLLSSTSSATTTTDSIDILPANSHSSFFNGDVASCIQEALKDSLNINITEVEKLKFFCSSPCSGSQTDFTNEVNELLSAPPSPTTSHLSLSTLSSLLPIEEPETVIVIMGTAFIMSDARKFLKFNEPIDMV